MGLLIGFAGVLIILFLVFAMALAEWTDKDPGEWFKSWFPRWSARIPALAFKTAGANGQRHASARAALTEKSRKRVPATSPAQKSAAKKTGVRATPIPRGPSARSVRKKEK